MVPTITARANAKNVSSFFICLSFGWLSIFWFQGAGLRLAPPAGTLQSVKAVSQRNLTNIPGNDFARMDRFNHLRAGTPRLPRSGW
jgi:hypothetical protein